MPAERLITLEGGEGVGKSTLAAGLQERFERAGLRIVRTREPGGSEGADHIRKLIVTGSGNRWGVLTETLLLTAARNDHLERTVLPAIARGDWVLCDRFTDSTFAYQVAARGLPTETAEALNAIVSAPVPRLTIMLDLDVSLGLARAFARRDAEARFEGMDTSFHERVRQAFLEIAAKNPVRCVVLDANQPADLVLAQACAAINDRLGLSL